MESLPPPARAEELKREAASLPSWDLTPRQQHDLELLLTGGFSPLTGFMGSADHEAVCSRMRLADGTLWPIPICLDLPEAQARELGSGASLALREPEGVALAILRVSEVFPLPLQEEARAVYGTRDPAHPGVHVLLKKTRPLAVAGRVEGIQLPEHHDFPGLRRTPRQVRALFAERGWSRVAAFQTRNPMHRAHLELTLRAARENEAQVLVHPVVGPTRPGDLDHYIRVRCYQALMPRYPEGLAELSLLPLAMRMAGPREALWHALIRKNHGCTHFIVGRDHAGPGAAPDGKPFYEPYAAQEMLQEHAAEIGVIPLAFRAMVYLPSRKRYVPRDRVEEGEEVLELSGTELRRRLRRGDDLPEWFTYPEVASELRRGNPPRSRRGFAIFFTGLSGAGKSTVARALQVKFLEDGGRPVTLLDGDIVRKNLSSELGFSRQHRDLNIRRIGFVASEIAKNGGIALCAPIAPYDDVRREVREMVEAAGGGFCLVWVSTPIEVCEARDRKGLYARARSGALTGFTGVSDPYEAPQDAEVTLDTSGCTPLEAATAVLRHLRETGFLPPA